MGAFAVGSAIFKGLGGLLGGRKEKKAARQKRAAGYREIDNQRKTNAETERRAVNTQREVTGEANLRAAAGGMAANSTNTANVLGSLMSENKRQLEWLQLSNQTQLDTMKTNVDLGYEVDKNAARQTMLGGIGDLAGAAGLYGRLFPSKTKPTLRGGLAGVPQQTGSFVSPGHTQGLT